MAAAIRAPKSCPALPVTMEVTGAEKDGEAEDISEVLPGLFIGDERAASNALLMEKKGITYILNVSDRLIGTLGSTSEPKLRVTAPVVSRRHVSLCDHGDSTLSKELPACFEFLLEAASRQAKALVHCQVGANRSPTVVVAFLVAHHKLSLKSACEKVKRARPTSWPVDSYLKQLIELEDSLRHESSATYEDLVGIFRKSVNHFKSDLFRNFKQPEYELQSE
eukprot:RCo011091